MKHLKPRDILESLLFLVCFTALFAIAGSLETAPLGAAMWIAGLLAVFLWVVYFIVVARERTAIAKQAKVWVRKNGEWVEASTIIAPEPAIFDQDNYKDKR